MYIVIITLHVEELYQCVHDRGINHCTSMHTEELNTHIAHTWTHVHTRALTYTPNTYSHTHGYTHIMHTLTHTGIVLTELNQYYRYIVIIITLLWYYNQLCICISRWSMWQRTRPFPSIFLIIFNSSHTHTHMHSWAVETVHHRQA